MKKLIALLLLAVPCLASGPKYVGTKTDPQVYQEFQNAYHDIAFPTISTGTAQNFTIVNASFTHIAGPFSNWTGYTPSFSAGFGTVTNISFFWRRAGDTLEVIGTFQDGTVAASVASFTLPSGLSMDFTKIPPSTRSNLGTWFADNGSAFGSNNYIGPNFSDASAAGTIFFAISGTSSSGFDKANATSVSTNSAFVSVNIKIPISGWSF